MSEFDAKALLANCPPDPGVYRMIAADESVLYVGKAKNLKKRVSSYFQRTQLSPRIAMMVSQVARVDLTATRSEAEALLLENNLIKSLNPKYNILFRDDKSYPYICLSSDEYPKLAFHRGSFDKGAKYFGPYPSSWAVRESVHLLQKIFLLRTCENAVFQNRTRPCLLHQIKRCSAPCVGLISHEAYTQDVKLASLFLNGRHHDVIEQISHKMMAASEALDFELAALFRDQIRSLQQVLQKQYVSSDKEEDVDIVVAMAEGGAVCVNLAMIRAGRHLGDRAHFPSNSDGCEPIDVLVAFLDQHYREQPMPAKVLLNLELSDEQHASLEDLAERPNLIAKTRGATERAWLEMAEKNARIAILARLRDRSRSEERIEALAAALDLPEPPQRIECFDISHTMGESAVASCVVFAEKGMKNSEYRRYNITGIEPGDDYAAMRQVLTRRYEKVASGEGRCPDLILIDGGRGQVNVAREVLAELGLDRVMMIGVAKGVERKVGLEQLIFPDENRAPLQLGSDHPALHLIQQIRDEAHRFAISGHRAKRAKTRNTSTLEDIPGVGPTRRKRLMAEFGGLQGLKAATIEDLCRVPGISQALAEQIYASLR